MTQYCKAHELHYEAHQRCPYCSQGVYPLRALRAIRDFAHQPWPHTVDVPTWRIPIKYSEAIRQLGRELIEIEAERMARCADLDMRGRDWRRKVKQARASPKDLFRAARVVLGWKDERPLLSKQAASYLSVIEDDGIDW